MNKKIGILLVGIFVLAGGGMYYAQTSQEILPSNTANMLDTVNAMDFDTRNTEQQRIIIDVRTPQEFEGGHLKGARNIDFYDTAFEHTLSTLDTNAPYSIYCRSGNRSGQALELMESLGFTDVLDLEGGITAWVQSGKSL